MNLTNGFVNIWWEAGAIWQEIRKFEEESELNSVTIEEIKGMKKWQVDPSIEKSYDSFDEILTNLEKWIIPHISKLNNFKQNSHH